MGWFDKSIEQAEREQRSYDAAPPHEKTNKNIQASTRAILGELRIIRWVLIAILAIAVRAMFEFAPSSWWYTSGY